MELITSYTAEEEQLVIQSALQKKQLKLYADHVSNKHFVLRNNSIQQYFIRLSYFNKKKYVLKYVQLLRCPANTFQILSNMSLSHTKMESYATVDPKTDNIHHKLTWDHDRMLDENVLEETMESDLEWFETLDDDKQFNLLMGLIELCSGSVKRSLYMPLYYVYSSTMKYLLDSHYVGKKSTETLWNFEPRLEPLEDDPEFDPKHPSSIEVLKQRKKWYELIEKYRHEVMPELTSIHSYELRSNGKKSAKTKSKPISAKELQAQIDCQVDLLQLLPIWIVKKILSYFNNEELQQLKKINSYWAFATQEIIKERKAREKINVYLEKMRANIDPKLLEEFTATSKEHRPKTRSKNMSPHYDLAALDKKLIPKKFKNLCSVSLETKAKHLRHSDYNLETGEMVPFPRIIRKGMELYKFRPCSLQDLGVRFNVDEELKKQKSYLTYSLSSVLSSVRISVDENVLTGW